MNNIVNFLEQQSSHPLQDKIDEAISKHHKKSFNLYRGLTLRTNKLGIGKFIFRKQVNEKRNQITIGLYKKNANQNDIANGELTIEKAISFAKELHKLQFKGLHPIDELRSSKHVIGSSLNSVFEKYLEKKKVTIKCTIAIERNYQREIEPYLGSLDIRHIEQKHVQQVVNRVLKSGRKSVAEKVLYLSKNLFKYAFEHHICNNVVQSMTVKNNAGGEVGLVGTTLSLSELEIIFALMRENQKTFNTHLFYLTVLLVSLGLRKSELVKAKWKDYNPITRLLHIERTESKTKVAIAVPIAPELNEILIELLKLSCGSKYIFPSLKRSKTGHMCTNTINQALKRFFSVIDSQSDFKQFQKFTVHDIRRTFRTLLSELNVSPNIAELCINHRTKNRSGLTKDEVYDRHVKLNERRKAHELIATTITNLLPENKTVQLDLVA